MWQTLENREIRRRGRRLPAERPGQRARPDLPEGTDLLPQIKHIFVLMMETHSYDTYLGTLGRGDGLPDGEAAANPRRDGTAVKPHHLNRTGQVKDNPDQSWHGAHLQWNHGQNDGFARSIEELVPGQDPAQPMGYWTEEDLPFYHGLARTFPLADRWFSSCLGPTFPNRRFLLAGTANGLMDDLPVNLLDRPKAGTIMDMLTRHGISWVNYRAAGSDSEFRSYLRYRHRRSRHHLSSL